MSGLSGRGGDEVGGERRVAYEEAVARSRDDSVLSLVFVEQEELSEVVALTLEEVGELQRSRVGRSATDGDRGTKDTAEGGTSSDNTNRGPRTIMICPTIRHYLSI